ncbi:MAG: ADOP family duplicated permease [Terriglobales bacterium]
MRRWLARWRELFGGQRYDRDLRAELAANLELHAAELERAGVPAAEARRRARIRLGGLEQVRENCRERRGWPGLENFWLDLRYATRSLRKSPGLVAVVVLTLALGLGANCAAFGLAWAAIFRPLPYPQANRLVWISATDVNQKLPDVPALSPDQLHAGALDLNRLFSQWAWVSRGGNPVAFRVRGFAMTPWVRSVSGNLFSLLGVQPVLGRLIGPEDMARPQVVVLSNRFWRTAYGADPYVVGQTISAEVGYKPYTIIGVLPARFHLEQPTDLWVPAPLTSQEAIQLHATPLFHLLGRRRAGVSMATVQSGIEALERRDPLFLKSLQNPPKLTFQVDSLQDALAGSWREPLLLLLGAALSLLLLACLNMANLMLARGRQRQPELALRLTLGCPRERLARQQLLDVGLLALAGGAVGWACATGGLRWLMGSQLLPPELAVSLAHLHIQAISLAGLIFAVLLTLMALAGFAIVPAMRAAGGSLRARVETGGRIGRMPHVLVAAQAGLAVVLVLGAGLLLHSFLNLSATNPGFEAQGRISFEVRMPDTRCAKPPCQAAAAAYLRGLLAKVRALPGVASAAGTVELPLTDTDADDFEFVPHRFQDVFPSLVTPGYFSTMGIALLQGRGFDAGDRPGTPKSVIVNQAFVDAFFPGQNVIGRVLPLPRCRKGFGANPQAGCTVVGVVANLRDLTLALPSRPDAYASMSQDAAVDETMVVRTAGSTAAVMPELNRVLRSLPPAANGGQPLVFPPRTLEATVAASIASPRFRGWLAGLFAALALALTAVGIFGVESHAVARRRHELGVRVALGASPGELRRWVLREALRWTLLGVALGLPVALGLSRLLAHWLYQVPGWDPVTAVGAPLLLIAVALIAAWRPAARATSVDPMEVLRTE